jgi:hypothetical protein
MHHPARSAAWRARDLRERWARRSNAISAVSVTITFTRAEYNGIRYSCRAAVARALLGDRAGAADLEAAKKFERVLTSCAHDRGNRQVTGVRADGTTIETTTWREGPEPVVAPPKQAVAGAGGPTPPVVPPTVAAAESSGDGGSLVWYGLGGMCLLLAAALALVWTLKK